MKFRFCGDLDCPDWVLAEMALLSKLTALKLRLLCQEVVRGILGSGVGAEALARVGPEAEGLAGAAEWILRSAARHAVLEKQLGDELEQLGLPPELAAQVCKVYAAQKEAVVAHLRANSFKLPHASASGEVRTGPDGLSYPVLTLASPDQPSLTVAMTPGKLNSLINDLSAAYDDMEKLSSSKPT